MNGYGTWKAKEDHVNSDIPDDHWVYGDTLTGFFRDGIPIGFCIKTTKYTNSIYEINYVNGLCHGRIKHTTISRDTNVVYYTEWNNGSKKCTYTGMGNVNHLLSFSINKKLIGFRKDYYNEQLQIDGNVLLHHGLVGLTSTYHTGHVDPNNKGSIQIYYGRIVGNIGNVEFKSINMTYNVDGTSMDGTKK